MYVIQCFFHHYTIIISSNLLFCSLPYISIYITLLPHYCLIYLSIVSRFFLSNKILILSTLSIHTLSYFLWPPWNYHYSFLLPILNTWSYRFHKLYYLTLYALIYKLFNHFLQNHTQFDSVLFLLIFSSLVLYLQALFITTVQHSFTYSGYYIIWNHYAFWHLTPLHIFY